MADEIEGSNQAIPGEWVVRLDPQRIGALARVDLMRAYEASEDRDDAIHRGLGLVMAGLALLHANGSHRGTVAGWVKGYLDKLYGRMN